MTRETFRSVPLRTAGGWVVIRLMQDGDWHPLVHTVARTRAGSIDQANAGAYDPDWYRLARRRGEALAVHCVIQPITFERGGNR